MTSRACGRGTRQGRACGPRSSVQRVDQRARRVERAALDGCALLPSEGDHDENNEGDQSRPFRTVPAAVLDRSVDACSERVVL